MEKLNKLQLEDLMVTVCEGGSNYWLDISSSQRKIVKEYKKYGPQVSFAEKIAEYLWDGHAIKIIDANEASDILGELTLDKINTAFNHPDMKDHAESFLNEDYDADTTDCLIQIALFGEIVYS